MVEKLRKYEGMPQRAYIFVRKEGWYPVVLFDDEDAKSNRKERHRFYFPANAARLMATSTRARV